MDGLVLNPDLYRRAVAECLPHGLTIEPLYRNDAETANAAPSYWLARGGPGRLCGGPTIDEAISRLIDVFEAERGGPQPDPPSVEDETEIERSRRYWKAKHGVPPGPPSPPRPPGHRPMA